MRTTAHHYNCKERCDEFEMTIQHIGSSLRSSQLTTLSALALFRFSPSFIFAVTSFAFQFPFFNFLATPGAFWYGLKRSGAGIPDPFTDQEAEADTEMVELSIWGYALCTWAAGVYGMVCGGGENVVDGGGVMVWVRCSNSKHMGGDRWITIFSVIYIYKLPLFKYLQVIHIFTSYHR